MSKLEKKLKTDMRKKMLDTNPSDELYERVKKELNMKEKQKQYLVNKPYKRWVPILATSFCILLAIVIGVIALNNKKVNAKEYNAIVQVDVNPSIQMVVDEENKVLSITGLNDEGKMIIYGEAIVGKNLDEALEIIVKIETDLGYLVEGSDDNKVTLTISANTEEITNKIEEFSRNTLNKVLEETGVIATIETAKGYAEEELKLLAKELDPTLTEEEINNFNYNDYVHVVQLYHLEVADLASVKLEEMYNEFKNYQISITEKEAVKNAVNHLDIIYQGLIHEYNLAYDALNNAYTSMQDGYYSQFIDPTSEYQKAWLELAELKQAYLDQRVVVANLTEEETDEKIFQEVQKLESLKREYEAKLAILESIEKASSTVYETLVLVFETSLETMKKIEEQLPDSIQTITFEALIDTENKLNEFKQEVCDTFEAKYQEAIDNAKETLQARKEALRASLHNNDSQSYE
jgi:membrane associated protein